MSYSFIVRDADAKVSKEIAERETAKLVAEKIALLDAYGEDKFADHTVIRFNKQFDNGGKAYTYAAVKVGDNWTDTSGSVRTWGDFVKWLIEGPFPVASIEVFEASKSYPASAPAADVKADPKN